jgi:hypothetical protein
MAFSEKLIQSVWEKARAIEDNDPAQWRQDQCGAWIQRSQYNSENSDYGWKIESVAPGTPDALATLQPFHWRNSFDIGNRETLCRVTADRAGQAAGESIPEPRNRDL